MKWDKNWPKTGWFDCFCLRPMGCACSLRTPWIHRWIKITKYHKIRYSCQNSQVCSMSGQDEAVYYYLCLNVLSKWQLFESQILVLIVDLMRRVTKSKSSVSFKSYALSLIAIWKFYSLYVWSWQWHQCDLVQASRLRFFSRSPLDLEILNFVK